MTPSTDPARDEAVLPITPERLAEVRERFNAIPHADPDSLTGHVKGMLALIDSIAAAPAPASGVDAVREACAQAAEGPEYWPYPKQPGDVLTYRGTKDGNWLAVKPPFKLDLYSQGRADAAAAVRALSPAATSGSGLIDAPAIPKLDNGVEPFDDKWLGDGDSVHVLPTSGSEAGGEAVAGQVTWHSSEEGGGPDVGIEVNLGGGSVLYVGEMAGHDEWQIALIVGNAMASMATVTNADLARSFADDLASRLAKPSSPVGGDVREAAYKAAWEHADDEVGWEATKGLAAAGNTYMQGQVEWHREMIDKALDAALSPATSAAEPVAITARYTNWRGETAERTFIPRRVFFGSNEWHPEPQVLIEATDCEKGALRTFAAAGFAHPAPAAVESAQGVKEAPWGGVSHSQIEELADRVMGRGMNGLTTDDWPTLVNILEAASFLRGQEAADA